MLNVTRRLRLPVIVATTLTVAGFAGLASAGSAFADHAEGSESPVTLNGDWAPFNRCPVDDPLMLAADGATNVALCLAVNSPNGSLTVGNLNITTKDSNIQSGLTENNTAGSFTLVSPAAGTVLAESIEIPGGLRGLICPSRERFVWHVCRDHHDGRGNEGWGNDVFNAVTSTLVSAGNSSNFNLYAGLSLNQPIVSLPVKIHLQNHLLGRNCYIGSDTEPIAIQVENLTVPTGTYEMFDGNGTPDPSGPMARFQLHATQGSSSFAVPVASDCGFAGIFDEAINSTVGLPSPAGKNKVLFNETTTYLTGISNVESIVPNDGKELSKNWHSAVLPEEEEQDGRHGLRHKH
jgi:hypothetical protein